MDLELNLSVKYVEIIGNYSKISYWGRRSYERHFTEWRHSYGMKCLKIPNSVHFRDITSIADALACTFIYFSASKIDD